MKSGVMAGEGYTQEPGKEHAEIIAIRNAGEQAKGAELHVTLEPCSHHGRTPPCTDAIIKAGIKKVYYGYLDPNPQVAGNGIEKLKAAGIEVVKENLNGQIDIFYESYSWFVKNKSPFVTLKIAQTIDGFIANSDKSPVKITGEESQTELHRLRSFCDAVVVGGSTFRFDNPQLTVRKVKGASPQKIIFSKSNYKGESFEESWHLMLSDCTKKGMHHLLVEAGATMAKELFEIPNSFQKFLLWTSPLRIKNGLSWLHALKKLAPKRSYFQGNDFCQEFVNH
jgi:diaminohydroxyphosphoribosylaminopyrimidine deaminase/5-amino-6-(5-phosphoribosylamino)uracil reductase